MYNLDVAVADTFFVGTQGWLVHNQDRVGDACNLAYRKLRKATVDNWLNDGVEVAGQKYTINPHAAKNWNKDSARKDIMPSEVIEALGTKPIPGTNGAIIHVNPTTGSWVAVNPTTQQIIQVAPKSFGLPK